MAGPSVNYATEGQNNAGGTLYNNTLGAGANASATVDFSAGGCFGGDVSVKGTTNTSVSGTNGLKIEVFPQRDAGGDFDTVPSQSYTFSPVIASTTYAKTLRLPTGIYSVKVTNLDGTYTYTALTITASKIS